MVGSGPQAVDQLAASDLLLNVHGARCVIKPIGAKARFPALSPGHCTLMYGDVVIKHVDFYSSVHTRCIVVHRRTQHAAQRA